MHTNVRKSDPAPLPIGSFLHRTQRRPSMFINLSFQIQLWTDAAQPLQEHTGDRPSASAEAASVSPYSSYPPYTDMATSDERRCPFPAKKFGVCIIAEQSLSNAAQPYAEHPHR